jgi:amino-acid N-acetyltransferase
MIRKANLKDIKPIYNLLHEFGKKGELLPRPISQLYDHVRSFAVYEDDHNGEIIGCCGLQFCWANLAEIRSMAVHPDHQGKGIGSQLIIDYALQEANDFGVNRVFTLTYRPGFFQRFGFNQIKRSELPLKIWADCITCLKFPDCDETAMMRIENQSSQKMEELQDWGDRLMD